MENITVIDLMKDKKQTKKIDEFLKEMEDYKR